MKKNVWARWASVILIALLLWWLFWAVLIDEDETEMNIPETEFIVE